MTTLLVVAGLFTTAVVGVAVWMSVNLVAERRNWHAERARRAARRVEPDRSAEVNEPVDGVQAWLDERWNRECG